MHEGELLRKHLKESNLSVKLAMEKLGLKARSSVYDYFKIPRFSQPVLDNLEEKLGFIIQSKAIILDFPDDQEMYQELQLARQKVEDQLEILDLQLQRIELREDGSEKKYLLQVDFLYLDKRRYKRRKDFR